MSLVTFDIFVSLRRAEIIKFIYSRQILSDPMRYDGIIHATKRTYFIS